MNEFLSQFLIECREIVDQASAGLLALEKSPRDAELLDEVFRSFHTLKGSAGIVEFAPMEHVVHGAEDTLSAARSRTRPLTVERIAECLKCLDQITGWLDVIERTGELPVVPAISPKSRDAPEDGDVERDWLQELLAADINIDVRAQSAIRYAPDAECFFEGEDPMARVMALPQLLAFDARPAVAWPALSAFDPYRCNLILTALSAAPVSEVASHMKECQGECDILPLATARGPTDQAPLTARAREVLEAQIALLDHTTQQGFAGRVCAAGLTAENVLRFSGRAEQAQILAQATQETVAERTIQALRDAILQSLDGATVVSTGTTQAAGPTQPAHRTLRIDAGRIDALVRLTSELTVAKNALGHLVKVARGQENLLAAALKDQHSVLERLVGEVQSSVLALRVVPLRSVFQRFPRLLREMSANLNKPVRLEVQGEETEADKTIVEMLFEPLLHIMRNAIDHGVESSSERARQGKAATAIIQLRASRQSDHVLIEIGDDGGGIDLGRVRAVALKRGVVTEERLRTMAEAEIVDLIFAPGFSTAAAVTELSGRGVGMDAVRTAVAKVGGRVSVETRAGVGTTITVLLPFSVMMTRIMTVEAGGQLFGIPLDAVTETLRVPLASIAAIGAGRALVVRGRTVPVITLAQELGASQTAGGTEATIVITGVAGLLGGIHVDRVGDQMEVILQPMDGLLAGTPGVTGTTLLGDGRVLLILDVGGILQ